MAFILSIFKSSDNADSSALAYSPASNFIAAYVYVGNNPLKYRDPTGHVKTKIEQENAEEGAVGGINNIAAIKLDAGEYAKAEESALSLHIFYYHFRVIFI
jgi:hypothetical protein